jgi:hypothetical protein
VAHEQGEGQTGHCSIRQQKEGENVIFKECNQKNRFRELLPPKEVKNYAQLGSIQWIGHFHFFHSTLPI